MKYLRIEAQFHYTYVISFYDVFYSLEFETPKFECNSDDSNFVGLLTDICKYLRSPLYLNMKPVNLCFTILFLINTVL